MNITNCWNICTKPLGFHKSLAERLCPHMWFLSSHLLGNYLNTAHCSEGFQGKALFKHLFLNRQDKEGANEEEQKSSLVHKVSMFNSLRLQLMPNYTGTPSVHKYWECVLYNFPTNYFIIWKWHVRSDKLALSPREPAIVDFHIEIFKWKFQFPKC